MNQDTLDTTGLEYSRLVASLRDLGLVNSPEPRVTALTGGVSSLIVKVEEGDRSFCAKSALSKLKVAADWQVPVHRNQAEVAWMRQAGRIVPSAVPDILGDDPDQNIFAMQWLDPDQHPVWKQQLMDGQVSVSFARDVGTVLGRIHTATAGNQCIAAQFANDADFDALRLDPYLRATATVHPELAGHLLALSRVTAQSRHALIHGDVSPKNILQGPEGPILLDAECATYGDPAFDLAFCLNHLIIKVVHLPVQAQALSDSYHAMAHSYLSHVDWELPAAVEARVAALLPALALARIDGKSPVEYLSKAGQIKVRQNAISFIKTPVSGLEEFMDIWRENLK